MKPRNLFLIFLFAALLIAVAGSWLARTQLAGLAITSAMQRAGLSDVRADVKQFGPGQSQLGHFAFSFIDENARFQLEAQDVFMHYNFRQLSTGRVDSISIGRLLLRRESTAKTTGSLPADSGVRNEPLAPLKILAMLQQALTKYVIFNSLSVKNIILHGQPFALLQDRPLQLNSNRVDDALSIELTLLQPSVAGQTEDMRQLLISRLTEDSLSAELCFATTTGLAPVKLGLHLKTRDKTDTDMNDIVIAGDYHINPAQLQLWLQPFAEIKDLASIKKIDGTLSFSFSEDGTIGSIVTAAADQAQFKNYSADKLDIKLVTAHSVTALLPIRIQKGSYLKTHNFMMGELSLAASTIFLNGELGSSNGSWTYEGDVRTDTLTVNRPPQKIQFKDLTAAITADANKLDVSGEFSPVTVPGKFSFEADHLFSEGRGQLAVTPLQPIDFDAEDHRLSHLVSPWTYPFDLLTGSMKLSSQATWSPQQNFKLTAKIKLDDGGGALADEIVFSGLAFDHELELLPRLHSSRAGTIELKHLDSGVTSSDISTRLAVRTPSSKPLPQLVVQGLHGEIFGGSFSAADFIYDLNKNENRFTIKATDIDLAAIVETQQLASIQVTGRVDGTIPVEINEQGLLIEHGAMVNAVRAGTIRYDPGAGSEQLKQNPLTGIALDALKDFRYSRLTADVNFTPEGTLSVNFQLQGTSPELDTDRPVHLNINTEQNLVALLKSLRFAQGLSDDIDKKVRRQYEKSRSKK